MGFHLPDSVVVALFWMMVIAVTPAIQYAWTFFYLRLVEIDEPIGVAPPMYAAATSEAAPAPPEPAADPDQGPEVA
jgi:hypothetical protein